MCAELDGCVGAVCCFYCCWPFSPPLSVHYLPSSVMTNGSFLRPHSSIRKALSRVGLWQRSGSRFTKFSVLREPLSLLIPGKGETSGVSLSGNEVSRETAKRGNWLRVRSCRNIFCETNLLDAILFSPVVIEAALLCRELQIHMMWNYSESLLVINEFFSEQHRFYSH